MFSKTFIVPFRGKVDRVLSNGHVLADGSTGIEPVDLLSIAVSNPSTQNIPLPIFGHHSDWDFEAGTVMVRIESEDQAWLDALETFLQGVPDLRSAEIAEVQEREPAMKSADREASRLMRAEWAKGVQISPADLTRWKRARGR